MPKAPVFAAARALGDAGIELSSVDLMTSHNPFAVNDLWFAHETGFDLERMNVFGSSLIYGHPQAPTGARAIAELIHALRRRGGGLGLFAGCAAGDDAGAVVVRVDG
jgi:acetyl-CoA acetyltransferase